MNFEEFEGLPAVAGMRYRGFDVNTAARVASKSCLWWMAIHCCAGQWHAL